MAESFHIIYFKSVNNFLDILLTDRRTDRRIAGYDGRPITYKYFRNLVGYITMQLQSVSSNQD